jgi:hypothetical protein
MALPRLKGKGQGQGVSPRKIKGSPISVSGQEEKKISGSQPFFS